LLSSDFILFYQQRVNSLTLATLSAIIEIQSNRATKETSER